MRASRSSPEQEVAALGDLARDELTALWTKAYGTPPPKGARCDLLVRSAVWHLQVKRLGGLSAETRRLLRSAVSGIENERAAIDRPKANATDVRVNVTRGNEPVSESGASTDRGDLGDGRSGPTRTASKWPRDGGRGNVGRQARLSLYCPLPTQPKCVRGNRENPVVPFRRVVDRKFPRDPQNRQSFLRQGNGPRIAVLRLEDRRRGSLDSWRSRMWSGRILSSCRCVA